ncbi:MAG: TIGR04141 family sporadically distributed protein [Prevotella sp.]|nr:TIGR04141 family sporadically distributed protein [Prevotella sp.]
MAKNQLSILLIAEDVSEDSIIKQDIVQPERRVIGNGFFYYKEPFNSTPKWVNKFFCNTLEDIEELKTRTIQAVFIVPCQGRFFAICFGYGRNLIDPNVIVERFGMKVALNSIDPENVRTIDIHSLESVPKTDRIQSSKLSDISEFDINSEQDLLRAVTGKSIIPEFGKTVTGADALKLSVEFDVNNISDLLAICLRQFESTSYRERFEWIDHIMPIKKEELKATLDNLLIQEINTNQQNGNVWMAVPEVMNWDSLQGFQYTRHGEFHDDIELSDVLAEVFTDEVELSISQLKNRFIEALNIDNSKVGKWSLYKCIYAEIPYDGALYYINSGQWYEIENNYVQIVEDFYNNAHVSDIELPICREKEGEYNIRVQHESNGQILSMDTKLISSGVIGNGIEVCDLYTRNHQLIHIKRYGGSSVLSHLFNQGYVAANMLMQKDFRIRLNKHEDFQQFDHVEEEVFNQRDYEIVFAVLSKYEENPPHIPFFSKITFKHVASSLNNLGYKVSVKSIKDEYVPQQRQ